MALASALFYCVSAPRSVQAVLLFSPHTCFAYLLLPEHKLSPGVLMLMMMLCCVCVQVALASVSRLDRCYESLAGAAIYSSAAAQERHLRCVIEAYFVVDESQEQQQDQEGPVTAKAAAGAAGAAVDNDEEDGCDQPNTLPWGAAHPVLRPSKEALMRQLRAALHSSAARAKDLGPGKFTGLVLARMVVGLGSPAVPMSFWKGCREWGRMATVDFRLVAAAAEQVVQEFWEAEIGGGGRGGRRAMG